MFINPAVDMSDRQSLKEGLDGCLIPGGQAWLPTQELLLS